MKRSEGNIILVEFTRCELENLLALLELTLDYDTLDEPPFNYEQLDYELSDLVSSSWDALSLIPKIKSSLNNNPR